jgi:acyl carrier protein
MIVIKNIGDLYKVIDKDSILKSITDVMGSDDINLECEHWVDLGMDDLDHIEFIMNLEKRCDLSINDDVCEELFSNGPNHLINNILSEKRENRLNIILNSN